MTGLKKLLMWKALSGGGTAPQTETLSGSIVSFETSKARPLQQCRVDFLPVQSGSGDPSPENVRQISGWDGLTVYKAGKNLFDVNTAIAGKYVRAGNISDGKPLGAENSTPTFSCSDYIKVSPGKAYTTTVPHFTSASAAGLVFYADKTVESAISGIATQTQGDAVYSFTTPNNCNYLRFSWDNANGNNCQLEPGSTATTYEPYTATTYPVTWQSAGTVYGGYVDLVRGVLVETHECITSTWGGFENKNIRGDNTRGRINTIHNAGSGGGTNSICNVAKKFWNYTDDTTHFYVDGMYAYLFLPNNTDENLEIQITYQLATPITYTLTPQQITTLIGTNNIWSDAGDVTVTYTK